MSRQRRQEENRQNRKNAKDGVLKNCSNSAKIENLHTGFIAIELGYAIIIVDFNFVHLTEVRLWQNAFFKRKLMMN